MTSRLSSHGHDEGVVRLSSPRVSRNHNHYLTHLNLSRDLTSAARQYATGRVLDMGCGNKPYRELFAASDAYMGCDVVQSSEHLVDVLCSCTRLAFKDASFETVLCSQVLEHVNDPAGAIREAARVLRRGGYFLVSVPMVWELHEEPHDYFRFTKYAIRSLFDEAGFDTVEIIPSGGKWASIGQLRLSMIWSSYGDHPTLAHWHRRLIALSGVRVLMNSWYAWRDALEPDEILPLNYVAIGRRR
jgi:SAM-dependent methyltransferase